MKIVMWLCRYLTGIRNNVSTPQRPEAKRERPWLF